MLKIRRSRDRLIFNMVIPIPWKDVFFILRRDPDGDEPTVVQTLIDMVYDIDFDFKYNSSKSANPVLPITFMTSPNGDIFRVTGPVCRESTGHRCIPIKRPVTRSFDVFFDYARTNG